MAKLGTDFEDDDLGGCLGEEFFDVVDYDVDVVGC